MGMSIRNPEVERLARELAARRGISKTEAIRQALAHEVERERLVAKPPDPERHERLNRIIRQASRLPVLSDLSEDEILGYDEHGIPTR
ncbi:type II toxin-antitoxin system VapB family antitoxin [Chelativorans xinjiangense]|uniref:type II toxin-antitoxin system VapB family antitoxin n=1 Tax=Chelativorans xinjiangense TaxID=2681485 RepID=UPI0013593520|nr:type II toxin-antitoxin system VapB family antitoxin [Chelativorans xinjiangense]